MSEKQKYSVYLNAFGGASYDIQASSPKEAYDLVLKKKASLSDVEGSDWDRENPGEVSCEDGTSIDINDLDDLDPNDLDGGANE